MHKWSAFLPTFCLCLLTITHSLHLCASILCHSSDTGEKVLLQCCNLPSVITGTLESSKDCTVIAVYFTCYNDIKCNYHHMLCKKCQNFFYIHYVLYLPSFLPAFVMYSLCSYCISKLGYVQKQKLNTIRSGVFNQLFIQYFNDQSAWGDQSLGSSSTAFAH